MRVVFADDLSAERMQLRRIIKSELGFEVVGEARDGQEAIELCRKHRPDVVILDVLMPKLTGLQAAPQIVAEDLVQHVVVCSSQAQHAIIDQFKLLRSDTVKVHFCLKPYDPNNAEPGGGQLHRLLAGLDHGVA